MATPLAAVVAAGILIPATTLIPAAALTPAAARGEDFETPQTRLRPIGSPSAIDAYRGAPTLAPSAVQPSGWRPLQQPADSPAPAAVRQAVMMQAGDAPFSMPPGDAAAGPATSLPAPLSSAPGAGPIAPPPQQNPPPPRSSQPPPPQNPPPQQNQPAPQQQNPAPQQRPTTSLPNPPAFDPTLAPGSGLSPVPRSPAGPGAASDDYAPLAQPRLDQGFATLGNCRNISAPSGYRADRIFTCGPPVSYVTTVGATAPPPTYLAPPAQLGPPATLPPLVVAPQPFPAGPTVIPGNSGHRPLISFGQERYVVQIGQGIFGQPVAYVPGQTFRNALRYIAW